MKKRFKYATKFEKRLILAEEDFLKREDWMLVQEEGINSIWTHLNYKFDFSRSYAVVLTKGNLGYDYDHDLSKAEEGYLYACGWSNSVNVWWHTRYTRSFIRDHAILVAKTTGCSCLGLH